MQYLFTLCTDWTKIGILFGSADLHLPRLITASPLQSGHFFLSGTGLVPGNLGHPRQRLVAIVGEFISNRLRLSTPMSDTLSRAHPGTVPVLNGASRPVQLKFRITDKMEKIVIM